MIKNINQCYALTTLFDFQKEFPDKYLKMCEIIGEYALAVKTVDLVITLKIDPIITVLDSITGEVLAYRKF